MADDLDAVFGHADAPRALPPQLRARLSDVLLAEVAATPEPDDAVAARLADVDAGRPLPSLVRDRLFLRLHDATRRSGRRPRRAVLVGTAAGLVAVLGLGAVVAIGNVTERSEPGRVAGGQVTPSTPPLPVTQPPRPSAPKPRPSSVSGAGAVTGPSAISDGRGEFYARRAQRLGQTVATLELANSLSKSAELLIRVSPAFGPTEGGTTVLIRGVDGRGVRDVRFGGVRVPWVDARAARRILIVTPAAASPGRVAITLRGPGISIRIPKGYSYAFAGPGTWF